MPQRSLFKILLLTIITFDIYQIFWTYKTRQELVAAGQDVPPFKWLFSPLLVLLAVAFLQVMVHFVLNNSSPGGVTTIVNILSVLAGMLAAVAIIPVGLWWFYKYCKATEAVTKGDLSFGLSYGLLIALTIFSVSFVWPFIVQYNFNKLSESPTKV